VSREEGGEKAAIERKKDPSIEQRSEDVTKREASDGD